MTCSAWFLIPFRTTCLEMAPPTVSTALPHRSLIKKVSSKLAYKPVLGGSFSIESFLPEDSSIHHVGKKEKKKKKRNRQKKASQHGWSLLSSAQHYSYNSPLLICPQDVILIFTSQYKASQLLEAPWSLRIQFL